MENDHRTDIKLGESSASEADSKSNPLDMPSTKTFRLSKNFAALNHLILRDLNNNPRTPTFYKYSKDEIASYLQDPYKYQKQLRDAAIYIYGASSHFRRLIQYFVSLSDLSYIISPYRIDPSKANVKTTNNNYRKVLNTLSAMSIKTQFPKILSVCLREDTFYGSMWVTADSITIQQLPSDYCTISTIEGNVLNVSFDFSYFSSRESDLAFYPAEFTTKYNLYKNNRTTMKYQELDSPTSFAVKCNSDILSYSIPPFAGIFREIYDIEDYKALKQTKTALENYAMLVMKLGLTDEGNWQIDYNKAVDFWQNLDEVLPEEIGSVLSPMEIDKISFERSNTADVDTVSEAEENLFTAAGVSSLLFNNAKASANALLLSIKADQAITFGIVKGIEDVVNRYIQSQNYGKNFKVTFLDCSPFNRKEIGDQYLKGCQYGAPMVSLYCASQGLGQAEIDSMNFLENEVLNIKSSFVPLQSSSTQSGSADSTVGAPRKDDGDLTESGVQHREDE